MQTNATKIIKELGDVKGGKAMMKEMLSEIESELPDGKTHLDFGGGYVEVLKTKANVVLYFGFDANKNRVSQKIEIEKEEVLLWLEAMAESIWVKQSTRRKFGVTKKASKLCPNCGLSKQNCYCEDK